MAPLQTARLKADAQGAEVVDLAPFPTLPEGHVLVAPAYCGICGSDAQVYNVPRDVPGLCPHGIFGHEFSGEVIESNTEKFSAGEKVVVNPIISCYQTSCSCCSNMGMHVCPKAVGIGLSQPADWGGGVSQRCVVPERQLYRVPKDVDMKLVSLTEPIAVMVHGARLAALDETSEPLVLGAGTLGLIMIPVARYFGTTKMTILAKHEHQKELATKIAKSCGMEDLQVVMSTDKKAYDQVEYKNIVFETIGHASSPLKDCMAQLPPRTKIILLGVTIGAWEIDGMQSLFKELQIIGSVGYTEVEKGGKHEFDLALEALQKYPESFAMLQTHEVELKNVQKAFDALFDKAASKAVKVTIKVN